IVDSILDGEPVYLKDGKHDFLSIYMESEVEKPKGAVIIMHGRGYHPAWKDVAQPLRIGLPASGWHTLSIQMPVLAKDAKYYDYVPIFPESFSRIEAAIKFLKSKNIKNIVLIAHSCSVHMSMAWFDKTGGKGADAYIGIGMGVTDLKQYMEKPFPLDKFKIPVLDIYGQKEFNSVTKTAPLRLEMIKSTGISQSEQRIVPDADHYITDRGDVLLKEVSDWLNKLKLE
ncbi:MAG: alpha/beta hydrolase family protein, partial [Gammaproteobacteria bacterium]|nr:alpha/beta hydrolase family protein [Gammaproteobacteria bacterium]